MKAACYEQFGAAEDVIHIQDIALGPPAPGEVQVRIHASGVNPSDVKKRAGARGAMSDPRIIPHSDGAGVVMALGDGVDPALDGQRVWLCEAQHGRASGTAAEQINLPAGLVHPLPAGTTFVEGAAIPIPMMTAHRCLTSSQPIEGRTVLVTGAMGRVGRYALQMARILGARVIATAGSDADCAAANRLGAQHTANFRAPDYAQQLRDAAGSEGIALVVDVEFGHNHPDYLDLLQDNAVIASYASGLQPRPEIDFYALMFRNVFLHPILVYSMPQAAKHAAKQAINDMLERRLINHHIGHTVPLDDTARAHQLVESGARGAVIVEMPATT